MQYISAQYEVFVFLVGAGLASLVSIATFIEHTRTKRRVAVFSDTRRPAWQEIYMKRRGAQRSGA